MTLKQPYEVQLIEATLKVMLSNIEALEQAGDYENRNNGVWGLLGLAHALGYPFWINPLDDSHPADVNDEFRTVVYIQLPTGLVSWHVPTLMPLAHDGHTTEQKYVRCRVYVEG